MTLRSSDLQSDSDLDSIRNSCDVFLKVYAFQGYEDFLRHKGDRAINTAKVKKTLKNFFCFPFENFCSGEGFEGGEGGVSAESGYQGGQEICCFKLFVKQKILG